MPLTPNDLIYATWEERQKTAESQIARRVQLWTALKDKKRVMVGRGNPIKEEMVVRENPSFKYYTNFEPLSTLHVDIIGTADFDYKQAAVCVSISGFEEAVNSGDEASLNLFDTRMETAETTMYNQLGATGIYSNGTAAGGKQIGGLQLLVSSTPTTGIVGGIDRSGANAIFWRNQVLSAATNLGAPKSVANYRVGVSRLIKATASTNSTSDQRLVVADDLDFELYEQGQNAIQRHIAPTGRFGSLPINTFDIGGHPIIYDGGFGGGCPANTTYVLTPENLAIKYVKGRLFAPLKKREAQGQDATMVYMVAYLNMTMNCGYKQAVFIA